MASSQFNNPKTLPFANSNFISEETYTTAGTRSISIKSGNGYVGRITFIVIQSGANLALYIAHQTSTRVIFMCGSSVISNNVTIGDISNGTIAITNTAQLTTIRVTVIGT